MTSAKTALVLLLCFTTPVFAQGRGALQGQVSDDRGEPLSGANIILQSPVLTDPVGVITDKDGMYEVKNLTHGIYEVAVSFVGYQTATRRNIEIVADSVIELNFTLTVEVFYGDQIIVSASRRKEKILDAPASVTVVESEEAKDHLGLSAAEYIAGTPAVDNVQTGLAQGHTVVRGFNNVFSGALLTLVDNRITRVPSLRVNVHSLVPVTNHDIERIEVVLGPGAALYGPNSANGVMHIITRSPFGSEGTSVTAVGGERSLRKFSFRHAGSADKVGFKISGQYVAGTDWRYKDPEEIRLRGSNPRDYNQSRASGELRLDIRPNEDMTAIFSTSFTRINNIEMTGIGAGQTKDWTYISLQTRLLYKDAFMQVFHNRSDAGDTRLLRTNAPIVDKSTLTVLQAQHTLTLAERHRLTYGVDGLLTRPDTEGTINGANEDRDAINELGVYLQNDNALTDHLDLVAAVRLDHHNHIENPVFSPRAALVVKPDPLQTLRLTYNRAYGTPSTSNYFLDILQARDAYGTGRSFQPVLGYSPKFDIRAQGTQDGFTFNRDLAGLPTFRSPFAPVAGLSLEQQIPLHDPQFTNVMWSLSRGAVLNAFVPSLKELATAIISGQLAAAQVPPEQIPSIAAQQADALAGAFENIVPQTLPGLRNTLRVLNPETAGFDPVSNLQNSVRDIAKTKPTITETFELGYKGVFQNRFVFAADVYRTRTRDFVGPIRVETPNVFLDPAALTASLSTALAQALQHPSAALLARALAILDSPTQGGNANNTPVDELTRLFVAGTNNNGAAFIPFGTVTPDQVTDPTAVMLTYRNFGNVDVYGLDLSFAYYPNNRWSFTGSYSHVNKDLFKNLGGIADIALNAPRNKFSLGTTVKVPQSGLRLGARLRYRDGFPMNSGVYVGDVEASTVFDVNLNYKLPLNISNGSVSLVLNASNLSGKKHRDFVGAPEIGRLVTTGLTAEF